MKEFGRNYYDKIAYFNFDEEDELKSVFEVNKNPQRILELLSMIQGEKIELGTTLIIFDEIQECPEAKSAPSFKRYIAEHEPKYAVRFSKRGYRKDGYISNIPLYLARKTKELL